jgi:rare lipoprotein A
MRGRLRIAASAAALLLAACGSAPRAPRGADSAAGGGSQPPAAPPLPSVGAPAEPRGVARYNRPYTVLGRTYTPDLSGRPLRQRGLASWYGSLFHGQRTATGEVFDMNQLTAAHPTLPLPCYVRVTRLATGAWTIVRVNDRGPFKDDRIIDLSYAAARRLGFADRGTAEVEIETLGADELAVLARGELPPPRGAPPAVAAAVPPAERAAPSAAAAPSREAAPAADAPPPEARASVIPTTSVPPPGFFAQLGAFRDVDGAARFAVRANAVQGLMDRVLQVAAGDLVRVLAGPFATRGEAEAAAAQAAAALGIAPVIQQRR